MKAESGPRPQATKPEDNEKPIFLKPYQRFKQGEEPALQPRVHKGRKANECKRWTKQVVVNGGRFWSAKEGLERDYRGEIIQHRSINGCEYESGDNSSMRKQKQNWHNINVKWRHCGLELYGAKCEYKAKTGSILKLHQMHIHLIGVEWHNCSECPFKAKSSHNLTTHTNHVHNPENLKWIKCPIKGCDYQGKLISNLGAHKQSRHLINVKWHPCKISGCDYQAKLPCSLRRHHQEKHNINPVWFNCTQEGCEFKAKQAGNVRKHVRNVHNIGVVWRECPDLDCSYKSKDETH